MLFAGAQTTLRIGWTVGLSVILGQHISSHAPARDRQLDPISPGAPADIVKALVDQKQSPPGGGAMVQGQLTTGALVEAALVGAAP